MFFTSDGSMTKSCFVPFDPDLFYLCVKLPNYSPNTVVYTSFISRFFYKVVYLEMSSPVVGWVTGAQKCSILMGFLVGSGLYLLVV